MRGVADGVTLPREPPTPRSRHRRLPKDDDYRFDASGELLVVLGSSGGRYSYSYHGWLVSEMAPPRVKCGG